MSRTEVSPTGPTLEEVRSWPATVSVEMAALALGVSRAHAYECIKTGTFPARSIRVGGRVKVITSSILAVLDGVAV
jgi:predicted DNA-binding transcriptional regulator AlpA